MKNNSQENLSKQFWQLIDQSNLKKNAPWHEYNIEEHIKQLTQLLATFNKQQIIDFEINFRRAMLALNMAQIAELNMILQNNFEQKEGKYIFDFGLSTDAFIYFRCWLILKGKEFFDDIRQDIQSFVSGKYSFNIGDIDAEGLLYVADDAYETMADTKPNEDKEYTIRDIVYKQYLELSYDFASQELIGTLHQGDEFHDLYPKLVEDIIKIRI